jgi:hypothetical protein
MVVVSLKAVAQIVALRVRLRRSIVSAKVGDTSGYSFCPSLLTMVSRKVGAVVSSRRSSLKGLIGGSRDDGTLRVCWGEWCALLVV